MDKSELAYFEKLFKDYYSYDKKILHGSMGTVNRKKNDLNYLYITVGCLLHWCTLFCKMGQVYAFLLIGI